MDVDVGGLKVHLKADPSSLDKEVDKSKKKLDEFDKKGQEVERSVRKWSMSIQKVLLGVFTAVSAAVYKTVKDQSRMAQLAQTLGMTVEELSRLEYAAGSSGVRLEQLRGAILTLNRGLQESTSPEGGIGPASQALRALGVSATDSAGKVRSMAELLPLIATEMASFKDGNEKTAIALALFGEAGSALIPMLNQGASGLAALSAEAERLGVVLDTQTAEAALKFNHTMTKVWEVISGVFKETTSALLPTLQHLADGFLKWAETSNFAKAAGEVLAAVLKHMIGVFLDLKTVLVAVGSILGGLSEGFRNFFSLDFAKGFDAIKQGLADAGKAMDENRQFQEAMYNGWLTSTSLAAEETPKRMAPIMQAIKSWRDATAELHRENTQMLQYVLSQDTLPFQDKLNALDQAVRNGTISWYEYEAAVKNVNKSASDQMDSLLTQTTQTLGAVFKENKAVAIATALINTYQGVTKALASGPPPWNFAMAALVAASGFAQVASIRSANKGSSGGAPAVRSTPTAVGSGGNEGRNRDRGNGGGGGQQVLMVQGIGPKQLFSGDAVRELATKLLDYQRDGGRVILASA